MKSRKQLGGSDSNENDRLASKKGEYLGMFPLKIAKELRKLQNNLNAKEIQINQLIEVFEGHHKQYLIEIGTTLMKFNYVTASFNPETNQLLIGYGGHMWIVKDSDLNVK